MRTLILATAAILAVSPALAQTFDATEWVRSNYCAESGAISSDCPENLLTPVSAEPGTIEWTIENYCRESHAVSSDCV